MFSKLKNPRFYIYWVITIVVIFFVGWYTGYVKLDNLPTNLDPSNASETFALITFLSLLVASPFVAAVFVPGDFNKK